MKTDTVIHIENLNKSFGPNHVLRDFSFDLQRGQNVVVLGKSGSGKSVLIKCIIGLIAPDAGTVEVFGNEIPSLSREELARRLGPILAPPGTRPGGLDRYMSNEIKLELPSDISIIDHVVKLLAACARDYRSYGPRQLVNLRVALSETLSNAILYGNEGDRENGARAGCCSRRFGRQSRPFPCGGWCGAGRRLSPERAELRAARAWMRCRS